MDNEQIKERAIEAKRHFIKATRQLTNESIYILAEKDCPDWVKTMVREAHNDMLPDDYKFRFVVDSLDLIIDADGDLDETYAEADIYTGHLTHWLASNSTRLQYCDNASDDYDLGSSIPMFDRLQSGQLAEMMEVLDMVKCHLAGV